MSNIYLVVDGRAADLCIAAAYSNRDAAAADRAKDCKSKLHILELPIATFERHYWVFIVYSDTSVEGCFTNKKLAMKCRNDCNGHIDRREVLPDMRRRDCVSSYEYWVLIENGDVQYHDSRRFSAMRYHNEPCPATATRRRPYRNQIPYRIEVRAPSREIAERIARTISACTKETIECQFEYNVDVEYIEEDGEMVRV